MSTGIVLFLGQSLLRLTGCIISFRCNLELCFDEMFGNQFFFQNEREKDDNSDSLALSFGAYLDLIGFGNNAEK